MNLPPFRIVITSYEVSSQGLNPVLSHTFYGKTLDEAYGYAKSHLITDYFFTSSFIGEMQWGNSVLHIRNQGQVVQDRFQNEKEAQNIINRLTQEAREVANVQEEFGMVLAIQEIKGDLES